jgi:hypothetical protein
MSKNLNPPKHTLNSIQSQLAHFSWNAPNLFCFNKKPEENPFQKLVHAMPVLVEPWKYLAEVMEY